MAKDTPILVKIDGVIKRTTFEELDKLYFNNGNIEKLFDGEYVETKNLEVLTVENNKVVWKPVKYLIRHKVDKILEVRFEGGKIKLTGNHSVMVFNENGELTTKHAKDLKVGDYIISFVSTLEGKRNELELNSKIVNTKRTVKIEKLEMDELTSYVLGLYTAEGALGFKNNTSGQIIFTFGYPKEKYLLNTVKSWAKNVNMPYYINLTSSGFNRNRYSAIQIRLLTTKLAREFSRYFYKNGRKIARNKRIPEFIYESQITSRLAYLKGLADGDGCGSWGEVVRISSVSEDLLVDIVWLSRISGIESSIFKDEVRLIWNGSMKYKKSDLLPAKMFIKFFEKISDRIKINWRYILRHQLYENKNRVSKNKVMTILNNIEVDKLTEDERKIYENLRNIASSDLHVVRIKEIKLLDYNDYVYDISVPNNEMFFAGETPILLHNSDERGIDVIRTKVKDFARTKPIGDAPFKIIFLDESDALTSDAQNALRRTMEKYSDVCRFILSCNYPSKIIPPIQSRCAIFRFSPLKKEDVVKKLKEIAEKEGLTLTPEGIEAIIYVSEGDMRKAINVLQTAASVSKEINDEVVYKVSSRARPEEIKKMIELALEGKFIEARELLYKLMIDWGMSGEDVILQIFREIPSLNIDERKKVELVEALGECDYRIVEGANERIQLCALLAKMCNMSKE
nr:replication factor C small subunit [Methanotorris igneus]